MDRQEDGYYCGGQHYFVFTDSGPHTQSDQLSSKGLGGNSSQYAQIRAGETMEEEGDGEGRTTGLLRC
jgi:hypothetical protein